MYQRRRGTHSGISNGQEAGSKQVEEIGRTESSWRRILLLILAITIHNIPGLSELSGFMHETHTTVTVAKGFASEVYHALLVFGRQELRQNSTVHVWFIDTFYSWKPAAFTAGFTGLRSCNYWLGFHTKVLKMSFRCWFVVDQFVHQVDMAMCNLWCNRKGGCDDINALEHVYVNAC